jgi:diadenosine tetraphosphate (Ap4A) HIT family hydrolase
LEESRVISENEHVRIIRDAFPISPGHTLIVLKRHISSIFEASEEEQSALIVALREARADLQMNFLPDGYNIGINDGVCAGQTVMHLHVHLIPRYEEDSDDPRGGVRWIFPDKAAYWTKK